MPCATMVDSSATTGRPWSRASWTGSLTCSSKAAAELEDNNGVMVLGASLIVVAAVAVVVVGTVPRSVGTTAWWTRVRVAAGIVLVKDAGYRLAVVPPCGRVRRRKQQLPSTQKEGPSPRRVSSQDFGKGMRYGVRLVLWVLAEKENGAVDVAP